MARRYLRIGMMVIVFGFVLLSFTFLIGEGAAKTITVDDSGGANYLRIQDAIGIAKTGDMIRVYDGIYRENIVITKKIDLIGNGSAMTTIDGGGDGDVVRISTDWVNMSGLSIIDSSGNRKYYGLKLDSWNTTISFNSFSNHSHGIYMEDSITCTIENNTFFDNDYGVYLRDSTNCTINRNICYTNGDGIRLWYSHDANITNNECFNQSKGNGIGQTSSDRNFIKDNICSDNRYGIYISLSMNSTIMNNICQNNNYGIFSRSSGTFSYNVCTNNSNGIYLTSSIYCILKNNNCSNNTNYGITLNQCNDCIMQNNTCSNNTNGIQLKSSRYCFIELNDCSFNDDTGIFISSYNSNSISNNTCSYNKKNGILLSHLAECSVNDNILEDNNVSALYLSSARNCIFENNSMWGSSFHMDGDNNLWGSHIISSSNTINGKPVLYYSGVLDFTVPTEAGQIILAGCKNISISSQNCSNGTIGIEIVNSEMILIENSTCSSNGQIGIMVRHSDSVTIRNSTITDNMYGMHFFDSDNCIFENNICLDNENGIYLESSQNSELSNNTFNSNSDYGVRLYRSRNWIISNNTYTSNDIGIELDDSKDGYIQHNIIAENRIGIYLDGQSWHVMAVDNFIFNNTETGIDAKDGERIVASYNWWGDPSGPYHNNTNLRGKGDNVTDNVAFRPWLLEIKSTGRSGGEEEDGYQPWMENLLIFILVLIIGMVFTLTYSLFKSEVRKRKNNVQNELIK